MDSRPPIPQGAPPPYSFVTRVYRRSLRPIVMATTIMAGIWALFSGIGFFRSVKVYNDNGAPKLGVFYIVLGILYMVALGIEIFGCFAAVTQKLLFVRIYAYLSFLVVLIAAATGLIRIVIHFTMKSAIINACTNVAEGQTVVYSGWWGPIYADSLDRGDATAFCTRYYDRDSWSIIVSFLLITFLAVFFSIIALNFLRQVLDPSSPANVLREPNRRHGPGFPSHYNRPYNPSGPHPPYGGPGGYYNYPVPAGPPPNQNSDAFVPPYEGKPPGYVSGDDVKGGYGDMYKGDRDGDGPSAERDVTSPRTGNPLR